MSRSKQSRPGSQLTRDASSRSEVDDVSESDDSASNSGSGVSSNSNNESSLTSYLLPCLMKRGMMKCDDMSGAIQRICSYYSFAVNPEYYTEKGMQNLVQQINRDINKYNMIVRIVHCEISSTRYYIMRINRHSTMSKFQTEFKKPEIATINELVQTMLLKSDTLSLPLRDCVNITRKTAKMNPVDGKQFIQKMMQMGYLVKSTGDGDDNVDEDYDDVTFGVRILEEFLSVFQENHPGLLKNCKLCMQPMLHGWTCPGCDVCSHRHCCENYMQATQICPGESCGANWTSLSSLNRRRFSIQIRQNISQTSEDTNNTSIMEVSV